QQTQDRRAQGMADRLHLGGFGERDPVCQLVIGGVSVAAHGANRLTSSNNPTSWINTKEASDERGSAVPPRSGADGRRACIRRPVAAGGAYGAHALPVRRAVVRDDRGPHDVCTRSGI